MTVKAGQGYDIYRAPYSVRIDALRCQHCTFSVAPRLLFREGDKSGQGQYNRARGLMLKHIYQWHREKVRSR